MKVIRNLIILSGILYFFTANAAAVEKWQSPLTVDGAETINLQQAKTLHGKGLVFIDVRSARQYTNRHISGAINLFVNNGFSEQNLLKIVQKDDPFIVYCNGINCGLSSKAATRAVAWGFTQVKYFREGARAWRLDGNPLQTGS